MSSNTGKNLYERLLRALQIELVKLHRHVIAKDLKVLIIVEGRDAAGKDGIIKRIAEHLSPREVRIVALGKPSDREQSQWYFQRFVPHLPAAQEIVLFNRSWYNRAGVEPVMGYCTLKQAEAFLHAAPEFERVGDPNQRRRLRATIGLALAELGRTDEALAILERLRPPDELPPDGPAA